MRLMHQLDAPIGCLPQMGRIECAFFGLYTLFTASHGVLLISNCFGSLHNTEED